MNLRRRLDSNRPAPEPSTPGPGPTGPATPGTPGRPSQESLSWDDLVPPSLETRTHALASAWRPHAAHVEACVQSLLERRIFSPAPGRGEAARTHAYPWSGETDQPPEAEWQADRLAPRPFPGLANPLLAPPSPSPQKLYGPRVTGFHHLDPGWRPSSPKDLVQACRAAQAQIQAGLLQAEPWNLWALPVASYERSDPLRWLYVRLRPQEMAQENQALVLADFQGSPHGTAVCRCPPIRLAPGSLEALLHLGIPISLGQSR